MTINYHINCSVEGIWFEQNQCGEVFLVHLFSQKKQRTKIESAYSAEWNIISGIPQIPVLGLILFNIVINNLFSFIPSCNTCNFAESNMVKQTLLR